MPKFLALALWVSGLEGVGNFCYLNSTVTTGDNSFREVIRQIDIAAFGVIQGSVIVM